MSLSRPRVSPYPLRSTRTVKQQISPDQPPIQTGGASEWEDVRCVICMEPPHNAVLLHCSSSANGCRAYMCDTSVRHSSCFKKYRRRNKNRLTKVLNCPLCRGEVNETVNVIRSARRFMNAKKRNCLKENCDFSGSYNQLNNHLKVEVEHRGFNEPIVAEPINVGIPHGNVLGQIHLVVQITPDGIVRDIVGLGQLKNVIGPVGALNYVTAMIPWLDMGAITMLPGWTQG